MFAHCYNFTWPCKYGPLDAVNNKIDRAIKYVATICEWQCSLHKSDIPVPLCSCKNIIFMEAYGVSEAVYNVCYCGEALGIFARNVCNEHGTFKIHVFYTTLDSLHFVQ